MLFITYSTHTCVLTPTIPTWDLCLGSSAHTAHTVPCHTWTTGHTCTHTHGTAIFSFFVPTVPALPPAPPACTFWSAPCLCLSSAQGLPQEFPPISLPLPHHYHLHVLHLTRCLFYRLLILPVLSATYHYHLGYVLPLLHPLLYLLPYTFLLLPRFLLLCTDWSPTTTGSHTHSTYTGFLDVLCTHYTLPTCPTIPSCIFTTCYLLHLPTTTTTGFAVGRTVSTTYVLPFCTHHTTPHYGVRWLPFYYCHLRWRRGEKGTCLGLFVMYHLPPFPTACIYMRCFVLFLYTTTYRVFCGFLFTPFYLPGTCRVHLPPCSRSFCLPSTTPPLYHHHLPTCHPAV